MIDVDTSDLPWEEKVRLQCLAWAQEDMGSLIRTDRVLERAASYEKYVMAGASGEKTDTRDEEITVNKDPAMPEPQRRPGGAFQAYQEGRFSDGPQE